MSGSGFSGVPFVFFYILLLGFGWFGHRTAWAFFEFASRRLSSIIRELGLFPTFIAGLLESQLSDVKKLSQAFVDADLS